MDSRDPEQGTQASDSQQSNLNVSNIGSRLAPLNWIGQLCQGCHRPALELWRRVKLEVVVEVNKGHVATGIEQLACISCHHLVLCSCPC